MSLASMLSQTVTVQRRTGTAADAYGNPGPSDWDTTEVHARLQQLTTSEQNTNRDTITSEWLLFLEADVNIDANNRVVVSDVGTFEVDGAPAPIVTPRGTHHLEVRLRWVHD